MNYKQIGKFSSSILAIEAGFMVPAIFISLYNKEKSSVIAFLISAGAALIVSGILFLLSRDSDKRFYAREGMVMTGLAWLIISLFGCLPFVITKSIPHFVDAFFEIVSGFTTTGASILSDVESLPKGILYWRSFSHWLGGMGVLVFMMAFLSNKGKDTGFTVHILRAESPGPEVEKLVPHMRDSSIYLYSIYVGLTVLNVIFLLFGGNGVLDSVCLAFGTAGTGGFGVLNDSFVSYNAYTQVVTTIFMMLFGVNFNLYFYLLILRKFRLIPSNRELRVYLGVFTGASILMAINIRDQFATIGEVIRHSTFQVASIMTTTGFSSADFNLWPGFSKSIILILMVIGASAGSTGGGMKCSRILILFKSARRYIRKTIYPSKVESVRIGDHNVSEEILKSVSLYLVLYSITMVISYLLISLDNFSVETNISAVLACLNNIGPGLDKVGPTANYFEYSYFSKLVLSFDMLAGRLELLPIISLLHKTTWRRR